MSVQLENRQQYYELEERRDSRCQTQLSKEGDGDYTEDDFEDDDDLDTVAPHNQQQGKIKMALVIVSHNALFRISKCNQSIIAGFDITLNNWIVGA